LAAVLSCSDHKEWYIVTEPMYIVSVEMPDTVSLGQSINYTAHADLENSCKHYSHLVQLVNGNEVSVILFKKWDIREKVCYDVVTPVYEGGAYRPDAPGTYTFYFWRVEGESLRREVVVR